MVQFEWKPDRYTEKPLYTQIRDFVVECVRSGEWKEGYCLPSQRDLARLFGVNRSTIVTAFEELKSIGVIEAYGRGGTKISGKPANDAAEGTQTDWKSYIHNRLSDLSENYGESFSEAGFCRLGAGEMSSDLFPKEKMARIVRQVCKSMVYEGYGDPKGLPYLREQVSRHLKTRGIHAGPDCILIVSGATQGIHLIFQGLLRQDSSVLLERPSQLYRRDLSAPMNIRKIGVPMDENGIIAAAVPHLRPKRGPSLLYTVPNFHNPTGIVMTPERRRELIQTCKEEHLPVLEDDIYGETWIDAPPPPPLAAMDGENLMLYLGGVSKTLEPSLRVGWIVAPRPVVDYLSRFKQQMDFGTAALSQVTVGRWLETGLYEEWLPVLRRELDIRRRATLEALNKHFRNLAEWTEPGGGYYIWLRLQYPMNMHKLFEEALASGLLLSPDYFYDTSVSHSLRISYAGHGVRELKNGLRNLSRIVRTIIKNDYKTYSIRG